MTLCGGGVYNNRTVQGFLVEVIYLAILSGMGHLLANNKEETLKDLAYPLQCLLDLQVFTQGNVQNENLTNHTQYRGRNAKSKNCLIMSVQISVRPSTSKVTSNSKPASRNVIKSIIYASSGSGYEYDSSFKD